MRKIIHIDMDAFYASVEMRDDPSLRGKPVIVGGLPGTRGVVCTCSYAARKFGIHSGMSSNRAKQLCPRGIFLKPRHEEYAAVSRQIRSILADYTDVIEPLSLDEAYLDVTGDNNKRSVPYATRIAREIRARIKAETGGLTASAGVSYNKFIAKVASDYRKPDGLTVILPEQAQAFLDALKIGKFYGIGRVAEKFLNGKNIHIGLDLRNQSMDTLREWFGEKTGSFYYDIARGIDERPVQAKYERKSLGTECTFEHDTTDLIELYETLRRQAEEVAADLKKRSLAGKTVTLKIKFFDFRTITRARSLPDYSNDGSVIADVCKELLLQSDATHIPVRLIGVTVSRFPEKEKITEEPGLFQPEFNFKTLSGQ